MKIDVQGRESNVLLGSNMMLRNQRINILHIEWSGDPQVIRALATNEYRIYDSTYIAGPKTSDIKPFEQIGFQFVEEVDLSTGKVGYELLLMNKDVSPTEAIRRVRKRGLGWIQTDLIAVSKGFLGRFLEAAKQYNEEASKR